MPSALTSLLSKSAQCTWLTSIRTRLSPYSPNRSTNQEKVLGLPAQISICYRVTLSLTPRPEARAGVALTACAVGSEPISWPSCNVDGWRLARERPCALRPWNEEQGRHAHSTTTTSELSASLLQTYADADHFTVTDQFSNPSPSYVLGAPSLILEAK